MAIETGYVFAVTMDVHVDREPLFNEVYDTEHVPNLLEVPGVRAVTRMKGESFAVQIGGERREVVHEGPRYVALYEIDDPSVLMSAAWGEAVEKGRWPTEVRPHTIDRHHVLYRKI